MPDSINITHEQLAKAFTEWERRFREQPDTFQTEAEKLAETPQTQGELSATFLLKLIKEQG